MKRLGGIWPQVVSFENLLLGYRKARRGKGRSPDVARFALGLETELLRLQPELQDGTYWPGAYRLFQIYERKPRTMRSAPPGSPGASSPGGMGWARARVGACRADRNGPGREAPSIGAFLGDEILAVPA